MNYRTILHCSQPSTDQFALVRASINGEPIQAAGCWSIDHNEPAEPAEVSALREQLPFDINTLPVRFCPKDVRLIVSDMDSTLITIECIDELADCVGLKPQVAAITEAAMRGELDFAGALQRRVALLEGLPETALRKVYDERLRFSPGAADLMRLARQAGIKTAVVSGGFTFFTERVKAELGLDFAQANELEINHGVLTGRIVGDICGPQQKQAFLLALSQRLSIDPSQTIAIGDGANDLPMMATAGLGVAFRAKPKVQLAADTVLNHSGLDAVGHFWEYPR